MRMSRKAKRPPPLRPFQFPPGFVLIIDTREQTPLFTRLPKGLVMTSATVHDGDYTIKGFESQFCIERKQMSDLWSYCSRERDKTINKMKRFQDIRSAGGWCGLCVEDSEENLWAGNTFSKVAPETVRSALNSFRVRYGVHVYINKRRENIQRWVLDNAIKFYKIKREVV